MEKDIAVLAGDGIGPEVMEQALRVVAFIEGAFNHKFTITTGLVGGAAYDVYKSHFPEETKAICSDSDAILFGSIGGPINEMHLDKWKNCETNSIINIRKTYNFNANFRPIKIYPVLAKSCPLKMELIEKGIDMLFIRELVGDIYFGKHKTTIEKGVRKASDVAEYDEHQIAAIAHIAFQAAQKRRSKVTSVDKANVLDTGKLWRTVVREVSSSYPDVELEDMLVDNCAMQIIRNPSHFDVLLLSNMFGDILSDAAAALPGSLGLLASASFNSSGFALYEPPGGSAPDIAGKGIANPIGQILCVAMMLRHSFNLLDEAKRIEDAVNDTLKAGYRTKDIYTQGDKLVSTSEMADQIIAHTSEAGNASPK
jgi:3-isopropylmalate dehydrogenase